MFDNNGLCCMSCNETCFIGIGAGGSCASAGIKGLANGYRSECLCNILGTGCEFLV